MNFAQNLQQARTIADLTQEEVADKLYVTRQTVSRWETNRTLPNIYILKDLSDLYNVSTDDLIKNLVSPNKTWLSFIKINRDYVQNMMKINSFWFRYFQFVILLWIFCLWGVMVWGLIFSIFSLSFGISLSGIGELLFFIFLTIPLYFLSAWSFKTIRIK